MATVDTRPEGSELGALSTDFLTAAESGRTLDRAGSPYSPAGVRSLRRALTQIESAAGPQEPAVLKMMDAAALERLGRQVVEHAGLPATRLDIIVDVLRGLATYAGAGQRPAERPRRRELFPEPPSWLDPPDPPPAWDRPPPSRRAAARSTRPARAEYAPPAPAWEHTPPAPPRESAPVPPPAAAPEARTPTFTMLALGAQVSAWTQRIIVIAFVLTAIGLALELL